MEKMIAGVFGAGRIGKFHTENLKSFKNIKVKKVYDVNIDHLKDWAEEQKVELVNDENAIWDDKEINAIFIFASTNQHIPLILKAAEKVKYIFCEKPLSMDVEESLAAVEKLKEKNVEVQIGFNRRFDPSFLKIKNMVSEGKIGEPHVIKITSRDPEPPNLDYVKISGGIFMDMAIHDFDMARYQSGSDVLEVNVMGDCLVDPEIAKCGDIDTAIIQMRFANSALCTLDISRKAIYGYDQRLEVFGSKGGLKAENQIVDTVTYMNGEKSEVNNPPFFFIERYLPAYMAEYKFFIESFEKNEPVKCSIVDGLKAQLIAVAAKESLETGKTVKVKQI